MSSKKGKVPPPMPKGMRRADGKAPASAKNASEGNRIKRPQKLSQARLESMGNLNLDVLMQRPSPQNRGRSATTMVLPKSKSLDTDGNKPAHRIRMKSMAYDRASSAFGYMKALSIGFEVVTNRIARLI